MNTKSILILFLCVSCGLQDRPNDFIPEDKMIDVLAGIQLVESEVSRLSLRSYDSSIVAFEFLKDSVLNHHGIDSAQYVNNYDYYGKHPKEFAKIWAGVEAFLKEEERKEQEALEKKEQQTKPNP